LVFNLQHEWKPPFEIPRSTTVVRMTLCVVEARKCLRVDEIEAVYGNVNYEL